MVVEREGVDIVACDRCPELVGSRSCIVNGRGVRHAKVAVVGQAPGREEDRRGIGPFVGPAGQTLRHWLKSAGLDPEKDVYYANSVRCLPPIDADGKEREPTPEEVANCHEFLIDELNEVDPDIVVPAGGVALRNLYEDAPITTMRGAVLWSDELDRKLVPILHPASAFHVWSNEKYGVADLAKAKRESADPDQRPGQEKVQYQVCLDVESVESLADLVEQEATMLSFDCETTSLDWQTGNILCVGVSWKSKTAFVVPILGQFQAEIWSKADRKRVIAALKRIFENDIPKIGQNGKFDQLYLKYNLGIIVRNFAFDTMLAYHLFNEEAGHSLDTISNLYTNMGDYSRAVRPFKKKMEECPLNELWKYQGGDCDCTLRVALILDEMLDSDPRLRWIFDNITMPMSGATMHMEDRGVLVDAKLADKLVETYDGLVDDEMKKLAIIAEVPPKFNHRSDAQKRKLLFDVLKLPESGIVTDKKKEPSVKAEALTEVASILEARGEDTHPILAILIRLNNLEQIMKTFLLGAVKEKRETAKKGLLNRVSQVDGRLHTSYRVDGTETGRLSASPNIQNIAGEAKSAEGAPIRALFIVPPGRTLLAADYSQIELRGLAYIMEDEKMIALMEGDADIHTYMAREIYGLGPNEEPSKEQRRRAKTLNFGLGYGMTKQALARRFGTDEEEAERLLKKYFAVVNKLPHYFAKQRRIVHSRGEVENIFGRKRRFYGVKTMTHFGGYKKQMGHIYRQAYNFPIQSSASDIHSLATAALDIDEWLSENEVYLVASVHDSVMFEVPEAKAEEVARYVQRVMVETARKYANWYVPVDVEVGPRWEEITHKLTSHGEWKVAEQQAA